jgi:hypothetical protein
MLNATSPEKVSRVGAMKMTTRLPFIHDHDSPCWFPEHYHADSKGFSGEIKGNRHLNNEFNMKAEHQELQRKPEKLE